MFDERWTGWTEVFSTRWRLSAALVAVGLAVGSGGAEAQVRRVDYMPDGSVAGVGGPVSRDGRVLVFAKSVPDPSSWTGSRRVLFARDLEAGTTTELPVWLDRYDFDLMQISDNGRLLGLSTKGPLMPALADLCGDYEGIRPCGRVFVFDLASRQLTLVSRAADGSQADSHSGGSFFAADGRYVFFSSQAGNLWPGAIARRQEVYRYDRTQERPVLVSVDRNGGRPEGNSYVKAATPDGETVVFAAKKSSLDPIPPAKPSQRDVLFLKNLRTGAIEEIDLDPTVLGDYSQVAEAHISDDGQVIAQVMDDSASTRWQLFDRARGVVTSSTDYSLRPVSYPRRLALSSDGRLLAHVRERVASLPTLEIFDRVTGMHESITSGSSIDHLQFLRGGAELAFSAVNTPLAPAVTPPYGGMFIYKRDADGDGIPTYWEKAFGLNPDDPTDAASDADGDGVSALAEFQANTHPRGQVRRYFAEGAANGFFSTRIAVMNPTATPTTVMLRYLGSNGQITSETQTIPANGRRTFSAANAPDSVFAILAEGTGNFVADRLVTWDASGHGSSLETAVTAPGTTWHFAEGATGGPFSLYYLLQNPGATDAQATVTYLRPAPLAPIVKPYTVPAHSRLTIDVRGEDPGLAAGEVSASIASDQPIVAERAMYYSTPDKPMVAGHAGAGIAQPSPYTYLPEGATGFFDEYVLIANPGAVDAFPSVTYLLEGGQSFSENVRIPKQSRVTLDLKARDARLAATPVSVVVGSPLAPLVVERVMWWPQGQWYEASLSAGATSFGPRWAIAEGEEGGPGARSTYVLIANVEPSIVRATVTVMYEDGTPSDVRQIDLPALSRTSVAMNSFPTAIGKRFSVLVEAAGGASIAVERSLYGSPNGLFWSAGATSIATNVSNW